MQKYKRLLTPHVQTTWLGVLGALSARGGGELVLKWGTVWGGGLVGIVRYPARGNFGRLQGTFPLLPLLLSSPLLSSPPLFSSLRSCHEY